MYLACTTVNFNEGHLGDLQVLAIMNKAAGNTCVWVFMWTHLFICLLVIYIFFGEVSVQVSCPFLTGLFVLL